MTYINRYKDTVSEVADVMTDQPMDSMEKAMYWIEYVIRHKGAEYLRAPAADVSWIRFLLVDVLTFISLIVLLFIVVIYKFMSFIFSNKIHKKQIKQKKT